MQDALLWLVQNNPHYKNVTISNHVLESLPIDGVLSETMTVESVNESAHDEITSTHSDPSIANVEDKVYNETTEMDSFIPLNEKQPQEKVAIQNHICQKGPMNWPTVDGQPTNEY